MSTSAPTPAAPASPAKLEDSFRLAKKAILVSVEILSLAKEDYANSGLDQQTKLARMAALEAKIDYLHGLGLNANAHPWVEDGV